MAVIQISQIQVRRGQENQTGVPQLAPGEFAWAQDTENLYIGKSTDEGAVDSENSRILTEIDYDNLFNLINENNTGTIAVNYKYRDGVSYITDTVVRTLQGKLDDTVSLVDFGVVASATATDITTNFRHAVATIFKNSAWDSLNRQDARRVLMVPAGNYILSTYVELPPYAKIMGAGAGLTKLSLTSNSANMFKTVDVDGNNFDSGDMSSGVRRAREVHISDMTLEYATTPTANNALISLDNVLDARVQNCILRTAFSEASTTTYGLVDFGVGIEIRGTGGGIASGDTSLCKNIKISGNTFDGLYRGVQSTGTVIRPIIDNNVFSNLVQGVALYTINSLPGPSNGIITENRFENIVKEGIYVGPNPNNYLTNHISSYNFFIQTGNGTGLTDFTTAKQHPIITFESQGNKSVNDYFYRRQYAEATADPTFYYNTLIEGRTRIDDGAVYTATLVKSTSTNIVKIPLTGLNQAITVNYQLATTSSARTGSILVNLSHDGYNSVSDNYTYTEDLMVVKSGITPITATSGNNQMVVSLTTYPDLARVDASGVWYFTGTDNTSPYFGKSAVVTQVQQIDSTTVMFTTDSKFPTFDFSTAALQYSLLTQDSPSMTFDTKLSLPVNYITLICKNESTTTNFILEYQISIMS